MEPGPAEEAAVSPSFDPDRLALVQAVLYHHPLAQVGRPQPPGLLLLQRIHLHHAEAAL